MFAPERALPALRGTLAGLGVDLDAQANVMLLDDNLLSFNGVEALLTEMTERRLAVNFSQTLDIGAMKV